MPRELLDKILDREGFIKAYGYEYKEFEHTNFVKYEEGGKKKVFPIKKKLVVTYKEGEEEYILKLDEEKIREEERFDEYYLIESSGTNLSEIEIAEIYHNFVEG